MRPTAAQPTQQANMSTATAAELPGILRRELDEERANAETPEDLPSLEAALQEAGYTISDTDGGAEISLEREIDGEKVTIEFNCEDMAENDDGDFSSTATVAITKGSAETLVFHVNAHMEEIHVDRIACGSTDLDDHFSGATFSELEQDLQESFNMYLYDRHIDSDLGTFIILKSEKKENDEYVHWLSTVADFVEK